MDERQSVRNKIQGCGRMKRETFRVWTSRFLVGFVLVTLGFSLGRHTAPVAPPHEMPGEDDPDVQQAHQLVVTAAHMTFRCPECNQIEWFTRELLEAEFASELASDRIVFRTVDYTRDPAFARRYNISSSTIVLSRRVEGEEVHFRRLDEVWTKTRDRNEFLDYVRGALREALDQAGDAS